MTQPKFAPILESDEVRDAFKLAPPPAWRPHRPADFKPAPLQRRRLHTGVPGPDQGYALRLAELFAPKLLLTEGEHAGDVIAGATPLALRRASMYGRAPVSIDIQLALELFGYLNGAPEELVDLRRQLFSGAAHDYEARRAIVDTVPGETLRMSLDELRAHAGEWETLVGA